MKLEYKHIFHRYKNFTMSYQKRKSMKKLQMLTLAMLLGSVQMMAAPDAVKLNKATAALPNISIMNKSNMPISVAVNVSRSGSNGNTDRKSNVLKTGESFPINSFAEGDEVKTLTVTYYNPDGTKALDAKSIVISGETLLSGPANNAQGILAKAIYVYGDSAALAGALSTVPATATTSALTYPSRYIAYWMGSASAASETAGSLQPVTMYGLSIDGKFTTVAF